ncbi:MAG: DUF3097 domain-containing protein [Frankiaceae bacterium]
MHAPDRDRYGRDVLAGDRRHAPRVPEVTVEPGLVVEDVASGWCGAVVEHDAATVTLEDRHGRRRAFPLAAGAFAIDGKATTLVRSRRAGPAAGRRTASGSVAPPPARARVALPSRILVEGLHDAQLVEQVWGDDLRAEGVAVEPLDGVDGLAAVVAAFAPGPGRRLGVLVDHLVAGSKESRIAATVDHPHVLVAGHPYVDVWAAVKPSALGIERWPDVPKGVPWKEGVCRALGVPDQQEMWRRVRRAVRSCADLEPALVGRIEELIDFVTAAG